MSFAFEKRVVREEEKTVRRSLEKKFVELYIIVLVLKI